MKNLFISASFTLLAGCALAQAPTGKGGMQAMNTGHVYGKVVDSTGKPVSDVSVMILQVRPDNTGKKPKEILLKGLTTRANGEFSFESLPVAGPLRIKISATGFQPAEQTVSFFNGPRPGTAGTTAPAAGAQPAMPSFDKDLGNISLKTDIRQLQGVTVTASAPRLRMDIDKKVYSVEKDIVNAGGTALDVMKNVPSVQVDIDGNVKLRNSAPQIYIEGRPTTLSLDQIPADAIESVEVITSPSAKYDASGGNAGILNIILKKDKKSGYNGNLRAGVDKRGGVNGGGDFSVRQGKFNFSASAMTNQRRGVTTGTTNRLNLTDQPQTSIFQTTDTKEKGGFQFGRLGVDYFATNRTSFSASGIKVHGRFRPGDMIHSMIDSLFNTGTKQGLATRNSSGTRDFNAGGLQLGTKHLFARQGEEWTADLNYFSGKHDNNLNYLTDSLRSGGTVYNSEKQQVIGSGTNRFLTVQTDYTNPLTPKTKLETGLRAQLRSTTNNSDTYLQPNGASVFIKSASATSNYQNHDQVYAAYATLTSSIKNFGYQLGLRAESSDYTGELTNTGEKFHNQYPLSLFPSVFLSQKLEHKQELQLSYTRRINRPNFFQLIPYTDSTDKLNITRGNPALLPEFTNSLEFSYSKSFQGGNNILASAYYKRTTDLITRYQLQEYDVAADKNQLINTFINANSSYSYGAELTSVNNLARWWDVTTNLNVYNSKINADNVKAAAQEAMWSWFGKINSNFKLPANFSLQLTGTYQSKTNLPVNTGSSEPGPPMNQAQTTAQGYIKPFYGVDAALKKSFLKNNAASATLSVSDIFRTRTNAQYSESPYFIQDYSRLRDPQMIRLTFAYRFGKMDMSLLKRKNTKGAAEGMQGATEGMGP